tara:strand:+ start:7978 stop:8217 length:240 start_codon:yes stop_codon:yes gene_type:complete
MSNNSGSSSSSGVGVFGLLGVLFVGLKLGGVIDWSWWWVTMPFYGPIVGVLTAIFIYAFIKACKAVSKELKRRKEDDDA